MGKIGKGNFTFRQLSHFIFPNASPKTFLKKKNWYMGTLLCFGGWLGLLMDLLAVIAFPCREVRMFDCKKEARTLKSSYYVTEGHKAC